MFSTRTGQITSVETPARWAHSEQGPVRPDVFISFTEESGLIKRLREQFPSKGCVDATTLPPHIRIAMNLSPLLFISGRLLETVRSAPDHPGLEPQRLQF
ncbi:EAL domain-containing protein [Qipengyuania spongiae]|uniref:EAL domain-containing protein n=1 Tax=Qipengyuania spongiae TaxID=2909673 RepID=UPI003B9712C5